MYFKTTAGKKALKLMLRSTLHTLGYAEKGRLFLMMRHEPEAFFLFADRRVKEECEITFFVLKIVQKYSFNNELYYFHALNQTEFAQSVNQRIAVEYCKPVK